VTGAFPHVVALEASLRRFNLLVVLLWRRAAMMETDKGARMARYKARVSQYKKNVTLLRQMAETEELEGFKAQILNLAESYMKLIESIDQWKTSLEVKSSSSDLGS
jgi:hypothetical protein